MQGEIEVRLKGEGIRPGLVRSRELAEILEAVEDFVAAETARADANARREDLVVGLYAIADESIGLRFKAALAAVSVPAFVAASQAVAAGDFLALSPHSLKPLQAIADFAKRHAAAAELKLVGSSDPIAVIDESTVIPEQPRATGLTEIAAKTLRVGGKVPRAMLELLDGSVVYCNVTEQVAVELGHHLYQTSLFTGVATWNASTLDLEAFAVESFRPFADRDPVETLAELKRAVGAVLEHMGPVDAIASRLRRGEGEA
jgi:hypothetical protein